MSCVRTVFLATVFIVYFHSANGYLIGDSKTRPKSQTERSELPKINESELEKSTGNGVESKRFNGDDVDVEREQFYSAVVLKEPPRVKKLGPTLQLKPAQNSTIKLSNQPVKPDQNHSKNQTKTAKRPVQPTAKPHLSQDKPEGKDRIVIGSASYINPTRPYPDVMDDFENIIYDETGDRYHKPHHNTHNQHIDDDDDDDDDDEKFDDDDDDDDDDEQFDGDDDYQDDEIKNDDDDDDDEKNDDDDDDEKNGDDDDGHNDDSEYEDDDDDDENDELSSYLPSMYDFGLAGKPSRKPRPKKTKVKKTKPNLARPASKPKRKPTKRPTVAPTAPPTAAPTAPPTINPPKVTKNPQNLELGTAPPKAIQDTSKPPEATKSPAKFNATKNVNKLSDINDLDPSESFKVDAYEEGFKDGMMKGAKPKHGHKAYKKFLFPLLIAYKLKFFTLVPLLMGGLLLLVKTTGTAGFFFALFAVVLCLKTSGGGEKHGHETVYYHH